MNVKNCTLFACLIFVIFSPPVTFAAENQRPFWTEQSTFIEGDILYTVGVASNAKTVEEGRELSFSRGRTEIMNYAQIANLDGAGIVLETQMTYEERNRDETYNVYRLLKTDLKKLVSAKQDIQNSSKEKIAELGKMLEVNRAITETFINKRLELEGLSQKGKEILLDVEKIKNDVVQKRKDIEDLYGKFETEIKSREAVISKIEKKRNLLDEQDKKIDQLYQQIMNRILSKEEKVKKYIMKGMTTNDVVSLMGEPDGKNIPFYSGVGAVRDYYYGRTNIRFNAAGIVENIFGL